MQAMRVGQMRGLIGGGLLHVAERKLRQARHGAIARAVGGQPAGLRIGVDRDRTPARNGKRGLAGIVFQHAAAERRMIDIEHEDFRIVREPQQELRGVGVEREYRTAARGIGAGLDVTEPVDRHAVAQALLAMHDAEARQHRGKRKQDPSPGQFKPSCVSAAHGAPCRHVPHHPANEGMGRIWDAA